MSLVLKENGLLVPVTICQNFMNDDKFAPARSTHKQPCGGKSWPGVIDKILGPSATEISTNMESVYFHNDRFELIVDARGYSPQDLKCTVTSDAVEFTAQKKDSGGNQFCSTSMTRSYQLPQKVNPQMATCNLSSDGVLVISAPWSI